MVNAEAIMTVATVSPPTLSARAEAVLHFIGSFWLEKRYGPSMADIGKGVGLSSRSTVQYHLRALQRDGLLVPVEAHAQRSTALSSAGWERAGMTPLPAPVDDEHPDLETAKQQGWSFFERLLLFCDTYPREHHRAPGLRDVADAFDITLSTAAFHIKRARWGGLLVDTQPGTPRGISLAPGGRRRLDEAPLRPLRS